MKSKSYKILIVFWILFFNSVVFISSSHAWQRRYHPHETQAAAYLDYQNTLSETLANPEFWYIVEDWGGPSHSWHLPNGYSWYYQLNRAYGIFNSFYEIFMFPALCVIDTDGDLVCDDADNCFNISNIYQTDTDTDGVGDACDNCPEEMNSNQVDSDGDDYGDICDNCPAIPNNQSDVNGNGIGDKCEDCFVCLSIDKDKLIPGETVQITINTTPEDLALNWTYEYKKEGQVDLSLSFDSSEEKATVTDVTGEGIVIIRAESQTDPDCYDELIIKVGCDDSCTSTPGTCDSRGSSSHDAECINSKFSLGKTKKGKSSGNIFLYSEIADPANTTPQALKTADFGTDLVILKDNDILRQVIAPESFVDITVIDAYSYNMTFYKPDAKGSMAGGFYEVVPGSTPIVTYTIANPDASPTVYNRLRITETRPTSTKVHEYTWDQPQNTWSLSKGNGLVVKERKEENIGGNTVITETIKNNAGIKASKIKTTYHNFAWSREIIEKVVDPDGAALTTVKTYHATQGQDGYEKLASQTNPDGSWTRYEYDSNGRKITKISSWLDTPIGTPAAQTSAVSYDYTPQDTFDSNASEDTLRPRKITKQILGQIVSQSYYVYHVDGTTGERTEITEQCASPSAGYGDASNLRTVKVTHPHMEDAPESWQIKSMTYPDGRLDSYTYEYGTYAPNGDPSLPGTFTAGTGNHIREIVVHGTAINLDGIANKTTRELIFENHVGNILLSETEVYTGTGYERIHWTVKLYDDMGRETDTYRYNNTHTESGWGCCTKDMETDARGITINNTLHDDLGRVLTQVREGSTTFPDVTTAFTYDAEGRRLSQTTSSGGLSLNTSNTYDLAGRIENSTDIAGLTTGFAYTSGGKITTITRPGNITEITGRYTDGRVKSITGTGVIPQYYAYGINTDGSRWTQVNTGSPASPMWEKATVDMLGRTKSIEKPGYTGTETTTYVYNSKGQVTKITAPGQADTLFVYDELGNQIMSGLDISANGILDLASLDRITESNTSFVLTGPDWFSQSIRKVYAQDSSGTATTTGIRQERLTGIAGKISETISIDTHGNETIQQVEINRTAKTETRTVDYPDATISEVTITENGLVISSQSKTGVYVTFSYDALERRTGVTDPRTGISTTSYNDKGSVEWIEDPVNNRTTFTYDQTTGRLLTETNADNKVKRYAYNNLGQVTHAWGDAQNPILYVYDAYGRLHELHTFQDGTDWNAANWPSSTSGNADITRWHFQESTGLLESKEYPDSKSVNYSYHPGGMLASRTWARISGSDPLSTTYTYDPYTRELTSIDYSDTTPDISLTYDRLGRQETVADALGNRTFAYNNLQLESETISGLYNKTITRLYDTSNIAGRYTGFNTGSGYDVTYGYESDTGRLNSVSWNANTHTDTATYSYVPSSDLLQAYTTGSGNQVEYAYELNRNLKTQIKNQYNTQIISQYDYEYNPLGQRQSVETTGKAFTDAMNARLMNAQWFHEAVNTGSGIEVEPDYRDYLYDNIGNRKEATGWENNASSLTTYTPNSLNQYDQANSTVTGQKDFTYDDDGNLISATTSASGTLYTYNAENRLVSVEPNTPSEGDKKTEFVYDYMGRRIKKSVSVYGSGAWQPEKDILFIYDGWNLIEEIVTPAGQAAHSKYYVWGLDLSQSLQGAGGIGGLIATVDTSSSKAYYYLYDANGNVGQLVDGSDGSIAVHYEYDPFGNLNYSTGSYAEDNPFRFSTKFFDSETSLYYYGYRYYSTNIGRWITRDPIGEAGGSNIYLFVSNDSLNSIDVLGLLEPIWELSRGLSAEKPGWDYSYYHHFHAKDIHGHLPSLSAMIGFSGTIAYYFPFPPPATVGGGFVKLTGQVTIGKCCSKDGMKSYTKWKGSFTGGIYAGLPGLKIRATIPLVEDLKSCPESEELNCKGIITASARVSAVAVSCTYSFGSGWSCSGGGRVRLADLVTMRISFGGGMDCSRTEVK